MFRTILVVSVLALLAHVVAIQTIMIGGKETKVSSGVPLYDYVGTKDPNFAWRETGTYMELLGFAIILMRFPKISLMSCLFHRRGS